MPDQQLRTWLTRNKSFGQCYHFYFGYMPTKENDYNDGHWRVSSKQMPAGIFHLVYPDVELKPGEGPIEVCMEIFEIRNGKVIRD